MLEMKVFLPEDKIIRQGEEGKDMYFIATGDCLVMVRDTKRQEKIVRKLNRGKFFGVRAHSPNPSSPRKSPSAQTAAAPPP